QKGGVVADRGAGPSGERRVLKTPPPSDGSQQDILDDILRLFGGPYVAAGQPFQRPDVHHAPPSPRRSAPGAFDRVDGRIGPERGDEAGGVAGVGDLDVDLDVEEVLLAMDHRQVEDVAAGLA